MVNRLAAWAAAVAVLAALAGCTSSGSSPAPGQSSTSAVASPSGSGSGTAQQSYARFPSAAVLLTQCALTHGVQAVSSSAQKYNAGQPKNQQWLAGGTVDLTTANSSSFTDWFQNAGSAVTLGGQTLGSWQQWAANHDELPAQVCGSTVPAASVRKLYAQVYAHVPSLLSSDPW
jgi:hypothetical protein